MVNLRTSVIVIFAIAGMALAVIGMPSLLDYIFDTVQSASYSSRSAQPNVVKLEKTSFRKVVFAGGPDRDGSKDASQVLADVLSKKTTIDSVCKEHLNGAQCEDTLLSDNAFQRPELKELGKLKVPGELALVRNDPRPGQASIYEFKSVVTTTPQSQPEEAPHGYPGSRQPIIIIVLALLGSMIGAGTGNLAIRLFERLSKVWEGMDTGDRVNLLLGTVFGIVVALPFLIALGNLGPTIATFATIGLTLGFSAISVYALNSVAEVLPWKRDEIRGRPSGIKVLDTNVLIDGRIYDLARTGFLEGELYVPKFVLQELQHIADSAEALRRQRGRRGLEVLKHLRAEYSVEIGSRDRYAADPREDVDSRLVRLAKAIGADLVSNDYNLNRVASLQEVRVLNINDLALSLRPNVLPGETLDIAVLREGSQFGQGVGYLEDGTMVVVENGRSHIGEEVTVTVTQVIQTERGKMVFGALPNDDNRKTNGHRPSK